ncbi:hypothetical protein ROLI_030330 [Roseobacter fucihabitans]|uniref:Cytochrome c n=1 Tax=Roseobacter fucihabitans TaxID=1537242 RepID=A0ABZ2BVE1_9RHOB|nr:cytochrome c [Roseobacter litoralis]MBC6967196.1 Cytochrome c-556 [Roseobacter litoralis]MBC6967891.1 Cytochrome c-556 [Roseobacter litoralis]
MKNIFFSTALALLVASAALAHNGVKNAAVMTRMNAMSGIGAEMKTLGKMAKGAAAFDANTAKTAAAVIAKHAANTPALFEAQEDDPKSEATAMIWTNFADFTEKAAAMETVALGLSKSISTPDDLGAALKALGDTCKACHTGYRQKR